MMRVCMCALTPSVDSPYSWTPPHLSFLICSPRFLAADSGITICNNKSGTNNNTLVCPSWVPGATFGYVITAVNQAYYGECKGQTGCGTNVPCGIDISSTVSPACSDSAQCSVSVSSAWGQPWEGPNYFCLSAVCSPVPPGKCALV